MKHSNTGAITTVSNDMIKKKKRFLYNYDEMHNI